MITLKTTKDTIVMIVVAGIVGAFAGLGAYALQSKKEADKESNLNAMESMLVGCLAAIGVLYFISPVNKTDIHLKPGEISTTSQYDLLKLVSLSAIVGSAGRAFLTSLQGRVGAALSQQTSSNVVAEAPKAVEAAQSQIKAEVEQAQAAVEPVVGELQALSRGAPTPDQVGAVADKLSAAQGEIAKVADQLDSNLKGVTDRINAAAGQAVTPPAEPTGLTPETKGEPADNGPAEPQQAQVPDPDEGGEDEHV